MNDEGFLRAICDSPEDEGLRLIYADWLEEKGDLRGEFLRLESALAKLNMTDDGLPELQKRFAELGRVVDPGWVTRISRIPIENCAVSFQFQCPKRWEYLKTTAEESVRYCEACRRKVYFCSNLDLAQTHAAVGDCIAVDPRLARSPRDLDPSNVWNLEPVMGLPLLEDEPTPKDD